MATLIQRKGINYDVGMVYVADAAPSRIDFDHRLVRRELEIIATDLHCNAVRVAGLDLDRVVYAAECALEVGLEVWFSPTLADASGDELVAYVSRAAEAAERLRASNPRVVFNCGCEMSIFERDIIEGATLLDRIARLSDRSFWMAGGMLQANAKLNAVLGRIAAVVRERFGGGITYASGTWEQIDWEPFDYVAVDHYRDLRNRSTYGEQLAAYKRFGKPVEVLEVGCCTYRGARDKGGSGWMIVDWTKDPPQLDRVYERDEAEQAGEIAELLTIIDSEGADGAFVFTFVMPEARTNADPLFDKDLPSYGIVTMLAQGCGTTYPDMPWEPKEAFRAVADAYHR